MVSLMEGGLVFQKLILHKQCALENGRDKSIVLNESSTDEAMRYLLKFVPAELMSCIMSEIN